MNSTRPKTATVLLVINGVNVTREMQILDSAWNQEPGVLPCYGCRHNRMGQGQLVGVVYEPSSEPDPLRGAGTYSCSIGYDSCVNRQIVKETRGFTADLHS